MELFLDSVNFEEIEEAIKLGTLTGLTTTPTFMFRHGITDIDGATVKLSGMVPSLHIEALGNTVDEIKAEVDRIMKLPLKKKPVFKIPVSNHGISACRFLVDNGFEVNIHLVYTLNQAYMAMAAGATYVCPLVGRLHDQGHDAMALIQQAVDTVELYDYKSKIMVSSVRHPEHVRQALLL
ncbi:MAG TPA: transaldolase family protein, partial [Candidatus Deferrimicrobium sp.]|nr:transaldolase family protein [Candidatus Deferrimicrobium sp.]